MNMPPTLFSEEEIQARVVELAAEIDEAYADAGPLVLIGVLKGSFIFLADLARRLTIPHRVEFIAVSSYGDRESDVADSVRLLMDVRHPIDGKHVLIVEDILDTGRSLNRITEVVSAAGPRNLRVAVLLNKVERREVEAPADHVGFEVPDEFLVGYGLDYAGRFRHLPYVGILSRPVYDVGA